MYSLRISTSVRSAYSWRSSSFRATTLQSFSIIVDIPFNCLLEYFIDYLEIPGKVCSFQAAGQIDEYIEIGNENDRSLSIAMYFDEFFYIFNANTGEVYPDVG